MKYATTVGKLMNDGHLIMSDGYRTKRSELADHGFRIIRVGDVRDGSISFDSPDFVSAEYVQAIGVKVGMPGDILLTTKGTVGRVAKIEHLDEPVVYSPQICFFRVQDGAPLVPEYLRYWLGSDAFKRQARNVMDNTDMAPYINLLDIRSLRVELPNMDRQRAVVEVLGAIDDKIIANEKTASLIADYAGSIFDNLDADEVSVPMSALARFVNGRAYTKGASGTGRVVVRIAELNSGLGPSTVRNDIDVPEDNLARPGDLLFAWSGSLTVRRWFYPEAIVNQHIFKIVPTDPYPLWLVHQVLLRKLADFKAIAAGKATTMGHIQRHHLDEPVPVPPLPEIERLHPLMDSLWRRALTAEQESLQLAELRDTLLPKLISGRLRVKDAEKQVEAVV